MAPNCFILCTAKQPIESNISHSSDKTFSEKQTAIFCLQRTASILNTLSQSWYCLKNSLEMLLQATPFLQQDELKQMLSSVFWVLFFSLNEASFCPPVKRSCDPINLRGGLWGYEMCHPARMPLVRLACSPL